MDKEIKERSLSLHNEIEFARSIRDKLFSLQIQLGSSIQSPENGDNQTISSVDDQSSHDLLRGGLQTSSSQYKNDSIYSNMIQVNELMDNIYSLIGEIESDGSSDYGCDNFDDSRSSSDSEKSDFDIDTLDAGIDEDDLIIKKKNKIKQMMGDDAPSSALADNEVNSNISIVTISEPTSGDISNVDLLAWYPGKYIRRIGSRRRGRLSVSPSPQLRTQGSTEITRGSRSSDLDLADISTSASFNVLTTWFISKPAADVRTTGIINSNSGNSSNSNTGVVNSANENSATGIRSYSSDRNSIINMGVGGNNNSINNNVEFDIMWVVEAMELELFLDKLFRSPWFSPYLKQEESFPTEVPLVIREDAQKSRSSSPTLQLKGGETIGNYLIAKRQSMADSNEFDLVKSIIATLNDRDLDKLKNYAKVFFQSKMRIKSFMQSIEALSSKLTGVNEEVDNLRSKISKSSSDKERLCDQLQALLRDARVDRQKNLQIIADIYS